MTPRDLGPNVATEGRRAGKHRKLRPLSLSFFSFFIFFFFFSFFLFFLLLIAISIRAPRVAQVNQ